VLIAHGLIALALITTTTVLGALHILDASAVTAIFGAVLGFAGGAGISQGAAIINGGPKPDMRLLGQTDPATLAAYLTKPTFGVAPPPPPTDTHDTRNDR
jgi:hypothetical protein